MTRRRFFWLAGAALLLAALLTGFFYVHEGLPRALRAPTALLLTPVAIASGLEAWLGAGIDVYETAYLVFLANFAGSFVLISLLAWIGRVLRRH